MDVDLDRIKRDTLAWVNGIREEYGWPTLAEMPAGQPSRAGSCPIANSMSCPAFAVGCDVVLTYRGVRTVHLYPDEVRTFVEAFDTGHFPELELGA